MCVSVRQFFLQCILDAQKHLLQQKHKARLTKAFHEDLQWWLSFLAVFNGTVYFSQHAKQHVYVDACNTAAGAVYQGDWVYTHFKGDIRAASNLHINFKEVIAVVQTMKRWSHLWEGKDVVFHTDSTLTKSIYYIKLNLSVCLFDGYTFPRLWPDPDQIWCARIF